MKSALYSVAISRRSELTRLNPSQFHVRQVNCLNDLLADASGLDSELSEDVSLKDFQVH